MSAKLHLCFCPRDKRIPCTPDPPLVRCLLCNGIIAPRSAVLEQERQTEELEAYQDNDDNEEELA